MNTLSKTIKGYLFLISVVVPLCLGISLARAECIGVITAGGGEDFWQQVANGATQAGKELDYPVIVRGPVNESDNKNQLLIMQNMLDSGCNALVMAPNSTEHIEQIEALSKSGLPIVFIDRDIGGPGISIVATDNFHAGVLAGEEMIKHLNKGSTIAVLRFSEHLNSTSEREQGFLAAINKSQFRIAVDEYIGTELSEASENAYKLLSEYSEIQGLFTPNELTSIAALNMRKRIRNSTNIIHIGFDTHPSLLDAVSKGDIEAIIIQNPFQIGYLGVKQAMAAMQGEDSTRVIKTPFLLVNAKNINSIDVRKALEQENLKTKLATNRKAK